MRAVKVKKLKKQFQEEWANFKYKDIMPYKPFWRRFKRTGTIYA
jgi:hypothetical protein